MLSCPEESPSAIVPLNSSSSWSRHLCPKSWALSRFNQQAAELTPFIEVVRHPYEEPYHVNLVVTASNGAQFASLEIYANAADLTTYANALRDVPGRAAEALWELGSERPEDNFAFYFRLRSYQTSKTGQCAVEVRLNNN